YCCSEGSLGDKIIRDLDKTPDLSQRSPQNYPNCGKPCTCELCGRGAHYGYNCPLKVPFVPDPKPFNNQTIDELLQTLPSFDPTCYSEDGNSFTYDSTSNLVHDSPNFPIIHQPIREKTCVELLAEEQEANIDTQPFQYFVVPQPPKEEMSVEFLREKRNKMDSVKNFLRTFNRISFYELPKDRPIVCYDDDDEEDYVIAVTPSLSTEEPNNSLSMGYEHLNTVSATESNEFIKSSVENLVLIPSEFEDILDNMCDVPFHTNSPPLDILKDQFEDFSDSNDESTLTDDDSFSIDNIEHVEASPPDSELVSSEVMEIVISKVGGIDDDILLTIKDDILREKLLNINLLIANIKALNDNPTPSSDLMTKSSSTSLNSLLEGTSAFDNSLPKLETFCFNLEEISSGSTTTRFDISFSEYKAFYDDHVKEINSGSTTTHSDSSLYDSFIFDLSINPFPPADRSDFHEFADELTHIISPPEYDCFCFNIEPNSRDFTMDVVEDISPTREPRVHNALPTHPSLQLNLDFILSRNEDTIFDPDICSYHISSFLPDASHRSGTFIKFKVLNESPMEISFSACSPMDQ
nr:hypothetical protein [Tanacetum cinerariifolium]